MGAEQLGHREFVPLVARPDVPRGRIGDPRRIRVGELRLAEPVRAVADETAAGQGQIGRQTPQLRLERGVPARSANRDNELVGADLVKLTRSI
jgi:hypothetical protein